MSHVFISYSHKDKEAAQFVNALCKQSYQTWIDEAELRVSYEWRVEIDRAIESAFAVIVVMSQNAKESEYVTYEWAFAHGLGKRLVPIVISPVKLHGVLTDKFQFLYFERLQKSVVELMQVLDEAFMHDNSNVYVSAAATPEVRRAVDELKKLNPEAHTYAIQYLKELAPTDATALDALAQLLGNRLPSIRSKSAVALVELDSEAATEKLVASPDSPVLLIEILRKNSNEENRRRAARILGLIGGEDAIASLIEGLESSSVAEDCADALLTLNDIRGLSEILDRKRDLTIETKQEAIAQLVEIGTDEALVPLLNTISPYRNTYGKQKVKMFGEIRYIFLDLVRALGNFKSIYALDALLDYLRSNLFDYLDPPFDDRNFFELYLDNGTTVIMQTIASMGKFALPRLYKEIEEGTEHSKKASIWILGEIGDQETLHLLEKYPVNFTVNEVQEATQKIKERVNVTMANHDLDSNQT
jgi:hypothetical protein